MPTFTVNAFFITVLDEGLYGVTKGDVEPEPMVILVNGDHTSRYWPSRELILRFKKTD